MAGVLDYVTTGLLVGSTVLNYVGNKKVSEAQEAAGVAEAEAKLKEAKFLAEGYIETGEFQQLAGELEYGAAQFDAKQLERAAMNALAAAGREAHEEKRQAQLALSRAMAVAGASGAAAASGTVQRVMAEIEDEGVYRSLMAIYEGREAERGLKLDARRRRREGRIARRFGNLALKSGKRKATRVLEGAGVQADLALKSAHSASVSTLITGAATGIGNIADVVESYG